VENSKEIRTRQITLMGRKLPIRTDVEDQVLERIVAHAEDRLRKVTPPGASQTEDSRHLLLALLVVTGELFEERTKTQLAEAELRGAQDRLEELLRQFENVD